MMTAGTKFLSVSELFNGAELSYFNLQEKGASSQDEINSCIEKVQAAILAVERESCFSKNEELDDYSTFSLKYLFLDYYLGKIYSLTMATDPSVRISHLNFAMENFYKYLTTCGNLRLLHEEDLPIKDTDVSKVYSAEEKRSRKIAKFKRQKEAQQQINSLKRLLAKFKDDTDSDQEEEIRRLSILQLQSYARESIDDLDIIKEELKLLELKRTMADPQGPMSSSGNYYPPQPPGDLSMSGGGPGGPGLSVVRLNKVGDEVIMQRDQIHGTVFGGGIAPPTMSLEAYADRQMADAMARQQAENQAEEGVVRRQKDLERDGEEDDLALSELATVKDREWDEFREENPKGWGNKMGKRY